MKNHTLKLSRLTLVSFGFCLVLLGLAASAQVTPIEPFVGEISEDCEAFGLGLDSIPNGSAIMNNNAWIESASLLSGYTCCSPTHYALGVHGNARVADGLQGLGVNPPGPSATIRFNTPVSRFGG